MDCSTPGLPVPHHLSQFAHVYVCVYIDIHTRTYIYLRCMYKVASLVAQLVKNCPAMLETWIQSLGWGNPLEKGMATHSRIITWRIPMDRRASQAAVYGVAKSRTWQWLSSALTRSNSFFGLWFKSGQRSCFAINFIFILLFYFFRLFLLVGG